MKNLNFPLFFSASLMGVLVVTNSSSWVGAWLGMELNLITFLPLLMSQKSFFSNDAIMKYFFISSISSLIILYTSIFWYFNWNFTKINLNTLISLALMLKLGLPPFHSWFVNMVNKIAIFPAFLLMTLQKIPPLILLSYNINESLILSFSLISLIIGPMGALNSSSIMEMLAFSSIAHLPWIMLVLLFNTNLAYFYFFSYTILLLPIIILVSIKNLMFLSNLSILSPSDKVSFSISILSLAGLPPFLGFFPKMFVLFEVYNNYSYFLFITLVFSAMISIYFYFRLIYSCMFLFTWTYKTQSNYSFLISNILFSLASPLIIFFL